MHSAPTPQTNIRSVCESWPTTLTCCTVSCRVVPCHRNKAHPFVMRFVYFFFFFSAVPLRLYMRKHEKLVFASSFLRFAAHINLKLSAHFTLSGTHSAYVDEHTDMRRRKEDEGEGEKENYTHNFHITYYLALHLIPPVYLTTRPPPSSLR